MAKFDLKIKARKLRKKGVSVNKIAKKLDISKSTASLWVRDIVLSVNQLEKLRKSSIKGGELGRLKGALVQKERRLKLIEENRRFGLQELSNLTEREFFAAGIALYWAEGTKKGQEISFCNSDPEMMKFFIAWITMLFPVKKEEIYFRVAVNELHEKREQAIREYWSKELKIPLDQFRKTTFKKVKNKKVYENFNDHYGTLLAKIRQPSRFYYKILGLIEGLRFNMPA
jgi:transcriptional regulator with XRE-family HTH domain